MRRPHNALGDCAPVKVSIVPRENYQPGQARCDLRISRPARPNVGADRYAVWLLPTLRNPSFGPMEPNVPVLVGVITPRIAGNGMLAAECTPPHAGGLRDFELLITLEPSTSTRTLGRYVLEGPISF